MLRNNSTRHAFGVTMTNSMWEVETKMVDGQKLKVELLTLHARIVRSQCGLRMRSVICVFRDESKECLEKYDPLSTVFDNLFFSWVLHFEYFWRL